MKNQAFLNTVDTPYPGYLGDRVNQRLRVAGEGVWGAVGWRVGKVFSRVGDIFSNWLW